MFDLFKQLAALKLLKFKNNEILLGDERLVFYYVPQLAWEQMFNYKINGMDYLIARYIGAKVRVATFLRSYRGVLLKNIQDGAELCQKMMNNFGFGSFSIKKINEDTHFMWINLTSTIAQDIKNLFGSQEIPVDFMYGGLFAGATEYFSKKKIYAIETRCMAQKNVKTCEFVVSTKPKVIKFIKEYAPQRLGFAEKTMTRTDEIEKKLLPNGIEGILKKW